MIIKTLQAANEANCCPCDWPVCAAPRKECESISGNMGIDGFFNPADTIWTIYKKQKDTVHVTNSYDAEDGSHTQILDAQEWLASEFDQQLFGNVGGCHVFESGPVTTTCNSSGSATDSFYDEEVLNNTLTRVRTPKASDDAPCPGSYTDTTTLTYFLGDPPPPPDVTVNTDLLFDTFFYYQVGGSYSETNTSEFFIPTTFEGFVEIASSEFSSYADFENVDCIDGNSCFSSVLSSEPSLGFAASAQMIKSRYRMGVPAGYSTPEAPRSTWEMTWDEVFASDAWWTWYDGGMIGAAPDASLALVNERDWTWSGDMESPWSGWYEIPVPETPGETRVVNVMVVCWKSTRLGTKPTAHGDQVALPE